MASAPPALVVLPDPVPRRPHRVGEEGAALRSALTGREREVLGLVAGGLTGAEIAQRLVLSPETIKSHVHNAMAKLGARTRAHAVAIAMSGGPTDALRPFVRSLP